MRSRGLVVALALLLAVGATVAVFLYVNGVRKDALGGGAASQALRALNLACGLDEATGIG